MDLSITTDFAADTGSPEPHLARIAAAGFTHIHWCHQWNTDFVYDEAEIAEAARWLDSLGLKLLDLHGSRGPEKSWSSAREYERKAGVALVRNRLDLTARLGGDAVVMHIPGRADSAAWGQLLRSLDELEPYARSRGVRLAIENGSDNFADIGALFSSYSPEYLGMCYDCGHGNLTPEGGSRAVGLDEVEKLAPRLLVLHLHDNDGASDQHRVPFTGTVDWGRLCRIIARSSYRKCISMESNMHKEATKDPDEFLRRAYAAGKRLAEMVSAARG